MNSREIWKELEIIIDQAKTAVLATADKKGRPHMRWVTPAIVDNRFGSIFMITSPGFAKVNHILAMPEVEWLFQTTNLDTIISINGTMKINRNASLNSEIREIVSTRLGTFWKLNKDPHDTVVLETMVTNSMLFKPLQGTKDIITF
ncbi:MAG: pyridoxamine 5'-phosphate oxidase family protein [Chitinivibrionales bacterium]|nr:pyridoxamine 5'-phosphate oxidase family protein [Chitinivibrionales bacterium]